MTLKQKEYMQKILVGIATSVIIALLGVMTTLMFKFSDSLLYFQTDNNNSHIELMDKQGEIKELVSDNKTKVELNTERSKDNKNRLTKGGL